MIQARSVVRQPLVLAELDRMIAARESPLPPQDLRELWRLLKASVGIQPSRACIERGAQAKARRLSANLRSGISENDARQRPALPMIAARDQCAMSITTSYSYRGRIRFAVAFTIGSSVLRDLGWKPGDQLGVESRGGLWVIYPCAMGWKLSPRSSNVSTCMFRVCATKLPTRHRITSKKPQELCGHEITDGELLICAPVWGEPKP